MTNYSTKRPPAPCRRRIPLQLRPPEMLEHVESPVRENISSIAMLDATLFLACDETASVERLVYDGECFARHKSFSMAEFFDLPNGADSEMDIEGLWIDDGFLWITGSHSLKRDKPDPDEQSRDKALEELTDIDNDPNRYFLGRVPLEDRGEGLYEPVRKLRRDGKKHKPACLKMKGGKNTLIRAVQDDVHLGPFLAIPSKDNGFDVEGIVTRGNRAFLGLRGPVLRGWAVILELELKLKKKRRLMARRIGEDGARYRKHFLHLDGLGVRELLLDGEDFYVLAGPTMDLDGPVGVYRWCGPPAGKGSSVTPRSGVEWLMDLPFGTGEDHAEGLVMLRGDGKDRLLVVYDSPSVERRHDGTDVDADVFDFE
jgi:hypothetical protein